MVLMVFLIQQSQNRDTLALQGKLAELSRAVQGAHNAMATAETLAERELACTPMIAGKSMKRSRVSNPGAPFA
jgi:low affinity Fe/Cu permease